MAKRRYWLYIIGSMSIAFILGTMLVIPIFNKQEDNIVDYRAEHEKLLGIMGDEPDVDNWWINPTYDPGEIYKPSSFNWTKFWNVFRNHAIWSLQAKHPVTGEWTDANELLTVHRNYTSDNSCKLGLEFTTPDNGQTLDWRFSLAIDYRVKNYVNKSGNYEYTLSYEAWGETFNVTFNWSDMLQYSGLIFKHGITNVDGDDYFWFRVRRNNVPPDYYVYLDPIYTVYSGSGVEAVSYTHLTLPTSDLV